MATPYGWDAIEADRVKLDTPDNVPNLDCMEADELRSFAMDVLGRLTIPTEPRVGLMNYAMLKADAIDNRLAGRIHVAIRLESQADAHYQNLPDRYRW